MMKPIILCIDDEKTILNSLKAQLKTALGDKFRFELAESAYEALELIDELVNEGEVIVIIISDWLMPGMKGDEFLTTLHGKFPAIIKILLTGQANKDAIENLYANAKLYRCLTKPWSEQDLINCIQSAIEYRNITEQRT
jgi:DNA-binding NtrC family response regulator